MAHANTGEDTFRKLFKTFPACAHHSLGLENFYDV